MSTTTQRPPRTSTQRPVPGMPARGLLGRLLPAQEYSGLAGVITERSVRLYLRYWAVLIAGFCEPLFYLLAVALGFGTLVPTVTVAGESVRYAEFVAPALLAASAMNGAVLETLSVFYKLRYDKLYEAMLATPVGPMDIALGEVAWAVLRGGVYGAVFLGAVAAMGLVGTAWALMLVPVALLVALAFAAIGMACATWVRNKAQLEYVTLASMAMFLFSATFFPLTDYPGPLQAVVLVSPLYHGVALARMFFLGAPGPLALVHVVYLVVMAVVGLGLTRLRLKEKLLS